MGKSLRLAFYSLEDFNEDWVCSVAGGGNQQMRREALENARTYLTTIPGHRTEGLKKLEGLAQDVHNYRGNNPLHLEFKLRMLGIIWWLIDYFPVDVFLDIYEIKNRHKCIEIQNILIGNHFA